MRERFAVLIALSLVVSTLGVVPVAGANTGPADGAAAAGSAPAVEAAVAGPVQPALTGQAAAQQCEEGSSSYPLEVEDSTNTTVTVEEEPQRVVTLNPSAAQTMWELGAKDKVVGVSQFAAYLDGAGEKANVSTPAFGEYNAELIVSLETDLVLAPNTIPPQEVERLRRAGLTVYRFDAATSIADIRQKTLLTGGLVGECEGARETVRWMDENLAAVDDAVADRDRPRTMYVSFGSSTGAGTFIDDMIETSGATNLVAEAGLSGFVRQLNPEIVAERDPQYLIVTSPQEPSLSQAPYNATTAVEQDQIVVINPNYLFQPAPRSAVYAVRNMTEAFHGDAYGTENYVSRQAAAQTPTATPTETATATPTETPTETMGATQTPTATESESQGQPGFGAALAVVAVFAALVLLRRRD